MCERQRAIGHLVHEQTNMHADTHRWTDTEAGRYCKCTETYIHTHMDLNTHSVLSEKISAWLNTQRLTNEKVFTETHT